MRTLKQQHLLVESCNDSKVELFQEFIMSNGILQRLKFYCKSNIFLLTGIAINKDGVIFIADGANIRKIDTDGVISTVIGSQDQPRSWKPISCDESMPADQVVVLNQNKFGLRM